ncbi:receptor L domain protein [Dictyocaulus viviparus]|uniref:Receptor L domain protein n=1 Tax=Dictyocaulus viviparus TaxID=29172 RepID=A0A0D8Y9Q9_DICVI|nr:receptor L domain protein [Dictyocaulus viviparus]
MKLVVSFRIEIPSLFFACTVWFTCNLTWQLEYDSSNETCSDSSIKQKELTISLQNRKCRHFSGELVIAEDDDVTEVVVEELESVTGCIHMVDTNVVKANFSSLKSLVYNKGNCLTDYALLVIGNDNLEEVIFHNEFKVDSNRVYIRANKKLKHERIAPNGEQFDIGTPEGEIFLNGYSFLTFILMKANSTTF